MTVSVKYNILYKALTSIYEEREARQLVSWLMEDIVGIATGRLGMDRYRILTTDQIARLDLAMERLLRHEPIQYVLGYADFMGMRLTVSPAVLIPRPETEELVAWVVESYTENRSPLQILDIGTGSGCIAISIAKKVHFAKITAMDVSKDALEIAQINAIDNQVDIHFVQSDILTELPTCKFDIIISNPPYISHDEMPTMTPNVVEYEPHIALFADSPIIFYKRIAEMGRNLLQSNGSIFLELSEYRALEIYNLYEQAGYKTEIRNDIYGKPRMLRASIQTQ